MDNKKTIGQRINSALTLSGKMQKELAAALGVTDNTVSYYVGGKRVPSTEQLIVISKYLGVSTDYLLGLSDTPSPDIEDQAICRKLGCSGDTLEALKIIFDDMSRDFEWKHMKERAKIAQLFMIISADDFPRSSYIDLYAQIRAYLLARKEIEPLKQQYEGTQFEIQSEMKKITNGELSSEQKERIITLDSKRSELLQKISPLQKDINAGEYELQKSLLEIVIAIEERYGYTWQA